MPDKPLKLIVIHGRGGTYAEALDTWRDLAQVSAYWHEGVFYVPNPAGITFRRLITDEPANATLGSLQKLAVARLLSATTAPPPGDTKAMSSFDEWRLLDQFSHLGIPLGPDSRRMRALELAFEAREELKPIKRGLKALRQELIRDKGMRPSERDARELILAKQYGDTPSEQILEALDMLRAMPETGGDLDTVASCIFYLYALEHQAKRKGETFIHGQDYRIVFVNYHESFMHLADFAPAEIYMADLPIGALPDFDRQARELAALGVKFATYEDHHPYTQEQIDMLRTLEKDGLIGIVRMSGPLQGIEQEEEELKCAADMVYERLTLGKDHDCPGMSKLRDCSHSEDLVTERFDLGRQLTELIKANTNKVELAQELVKIREAEDIEKTLDRCGWAKQVQEQRDAFKDVEHKLWENVIQVKFKRKPSTGGDAEDGGPPVHEGSDMPDRKAPAERREHFNLLIVNAMRSKPGEVKVNVGKATEYFSREIPDADYLFYAYGSRLLVTRRLNQADLAINLGALMPLLGGEGDGGHAGAAVCRPEANEAFPHQLIPNVRGGNFKRFAQYLADRVGEHTGHMPVAISNLSKPNLERESVKKGSVKIAIASAAAIVIGALLVMFNSRFSRDALIESNATFFPQVQVDGATTPATDGDADDEQRPREIGDEAATNPEAGW